MSGLDKIIEQIQQQAQEEAKEIEKKSEAYCNEYMEKVKSDVEKEIAEYNAQALKDRELYESKVKSGMDFKERNTVLETKQESIAKCLLAVEDKIKNLSDKEYFELLEKILEVNIQKDNGVMKLSERDLSRVPQDFKDSIGKIAKKAGGSLELSDTPAQIKDGFILIYGNIEENCTFKALFDSGLGRLRDIANRELFG